LLLAALNKRCRQLTSEVDKINLIDYAREIVLDGVEGSMRGDLDERYDMKF
jgi:hypothetical protein